MARWVVFASCLFMIGALGYRDAVRSPHAKALGGVCDSNYECRKGSSCVESDGVLSGQCAAPCNASSACSDAFGANSECLGVDLCARTCKGASDCPAQTICNSYGWCERSARSE
jgi:hypothetical protein